MTDIDNIEVFDASETDLKDALLLLKEFLLALVQSLVNYDIPQIPPTATEETMKRMYDAKELRTDRRKLFITAAEKELLPVPKVGNTGPTEKHRAICKIRFSNDDSTLHPTPDPMLLAAQAAVVWSVRQKIQLRASAVTHDGFDQDEWERNALELGSLQNWHVRNN